MNPLLWAGQIFLAVAFSYSGIMKSTQERQKLLSIGQTGVEHLAYPLIRFIGVIELLGTAGLILPWYLNVVPVLTPLSATGFSVIMVLAGYVHYSRGEYNTIILNAVLLCISVLVAYYRFSSLNR